MRKNIIFAFLALLTPGNVARSQWVQVVDPGEFFSPSGLAEIGGNLFSGTDAGVFYSTNDGINWVAGNSGLTNKNVFTIAVIGENIFAGCLGGGDDVLFLSTNGGKDWSDICDGLFPGVDVYSLGVSGGNLFAGLAADSDPVYLTTDNGATWSDASGPPTTSWPSTWVWDFAVNGNYIYVGLFNGGVMLSTNNGATWDSVDHGLPSGSNSSISALAVNDGNVFAGMNNSFLPKTGDYGICRSTDSGANWTAVNNGLTDTIVNALISYNGNLFAGTNTGAYLSTNNGESWQNLNEEGKPEFNAQTLLVHDGYLFAGGYSELWRRPLSDLNLSSVAEGAPQTAMEGAINIADNPFSDKLKVSVTIPGNAPADLRVINMLGATVATILSNETAPESFQYVINTRDWPNGAYFVRLEIGNGIITKRIIKIQ